MACPSPLSMDLLSSDKDFMLTWKFSWPKRMNLYKGFILLGRKKPNWF